MSVYDAFWRQAMGDAYREVPQGALTAIEQAALLPLRVHWAQPDHQEDRWWAAVPELREDGAAVVVPLFLDRVDKLALDYWDGLRVPSFSVKP